MEAVAAFSLVAAVLQVVDVGARSVSKCREIYETGSVEEYRSIEELTTSLGRFFGSPLWGWLMTAQRDH